MNNTLDFKRLGKVIRHDGMNFLPNLGLTLVILLAIPVVIWLISNLTPGYEPIGNFSRISLIDSLKMLVLVFAPVRLYKHCNDPRKGIGYAMLPASILEKFISMVFYCVVVAPVVYVAGALVVDTVLAVFKGPYEGFAVTNYFNDLAQINNAFSENNLIFDESWPLFFNRISPTYIALLGICGHLAISSIFMFGNMIFKKHKTSKMIGILILLFIIFMIIFINYVTNHETIFNNMNEENSSEIIKRLIHITMNVALYAEIIVSAVLLWGTYHKIKTQKY